MWKPSWKTMMIYWICTSFSLWVCRGYLPNQRCKKCSLRDKTGRHSNFYLHCRLYWWWWWFCWGDLGALQQWGIETDPVTIYGAAPFGSVPPAVENTDMDKLWKSWWCKKETWLSIAHCKTERQKDRKTERQKDRNWEGAVSSRSFDLLNSMIHWSW